MGEEVKEEKATPEAQPEEKKEEKTEEKKEEKKPAKEKKEEPPAPPPPFVLLVDLHCVGCAKKIKKYIMRIRGVEAVVVHMAQNQVTVKGTLEPQAICDEIMKKTKRRAKVLSPLPAAKDEPMPEVVNSQVSGLTTVELNVDMHCQACAEQLKRKILKMRGVQSAVTEHSTGKVAVTGTMDANKLVDYVYRRTNKQARIVSQPEPEPEPQPQPQPEPEKQEEKKEGEEKPAEEAKPEENAEKKEEKPPAEAKKEEGNDEAAEKKEAKEEETKEAEENNSNNNEEESMKRMVYYYQPLYVIEQMSPPPQLFSDENPNACCIF